MPTRLGTPLKSTEPRLITWLNTLPYITHPTMPPKQPRKADLRACLICSVIRPISEFVEEGCPNCEDILEVGSISLLLLFGLVKLMVRCVDNRKEWLSARVLISMG